MDKNVSKSKFVLALISLVITFFIWQQGLRDSLERPSVSFDISQKEKEIMELALPAIPKNIKDSLFLSDPLDDISVSLSNFSFKELPERNKLIKLILSDSKSEINSDDLKRFKNNKYRLAAEESVKYSLNNSNKPNSDFLKNNVL